MEDSSTQKIAAPYLAFRSFTNFVAGFKDAGIPGRIDRTVMAGQSGGTQSALLQTFKFLQLIKEDGSPTDQLSTLVEKGDATAYAALTKKHYAFVFDSEIDVERATEGQLREVFEKATGFTGETVRKAMTFFVQLAEKGGIKLSPHLKSGKGSGGSGVGSVSRPRRRRANGGGGGGGDGDNSQPNPHQETPGTSKTYEIALSLENPDRKVVITAPLDLSEKEMRRVHRWMQVTFDIGWEDESE